ncbi:MAG: J domain-containing protein [Candidatus Limnocylindrales bacterium]|jgi:curved DNA-binding protein CbpA
MPDFYEVLQVHPKADPDVIRAAYRTLARKYHPDHGGDARRMMALNDAWDVLGDPARRAAYDASRAAPAERQTPETAARSEADQQRTPVATHAGPPPGHPSGSVLDFGRYAGWSLGEIARHDPDYLEWLLRATFGRRLRAEIEALLIARRGPGTSARGRSSPQWSRRR